MNANYSNLTGPHLIDKSGVVIHGAASMTMQIFGAGGLRKMQEQAHLNGFGEGFEEGYRLGFEEGLDANVSRLVDKALAKKALEMEYFGN